MPSETIFQFDKNLVDVKLSGFISLAEFRKEGLRLKEYALTFGKMKYLVDIREAIAMPSTWSVAIAKPNTWWSLAKLCKEVAIVIREDDGADFQNIEIIARYTGAKVRFFSRAEEACQWLGIE